MTELDDLKKTLERLFKENIELKAENTALREAIIWMSGSEDFAYGGKAHVGWLKIQKEIEDLLKEKGNVQG